MSTFPWRCPYCGRHATIGEADYCLDYADLDIDNADGGRRLRVLFIVCPNPKCKRYALQVFLHNQEWSEDLRTWQEKECLRHWDLVPPSRAKAFPSYIPQTIVDDYNEACLICDLSPKASATLSRRCLQGIIRDFWKVKAGRLADEIEQIKDKVDPLTWDAIDSVRKVGNIGAHMEKDINVIVDVEANEANLLIGLIETVLEDWYIAREKRRARLSQIKKIADSKEKEKKQAP